MTTPSSSKVRSGRFYAILVASAYHGSGLLDLYEASAKEEYLLWAIRLQEKQDELFYDTEGGGYYASAPDEHILIRMKDAQVCLAIHRDQT